jgi:hypothetical protein
LTISLAELDTLLGGDRHAVSAFKRMRIAREGTYSDFVEQLYNDLDQAIYGLQASAELLQEDGEDRITLDILLQLRQHGYIAEHDSKTGGHVDLSVAYGPNSWIGEAKKDGNFQEGYLQLMSRYKPRSGDYSHNAGGLLFYFVDTQDARGKLDEWKENVRSQAVACNPCPRNVLAFFTEHKLVGPGTSFFVRTMAVSLYHRPLDKSGLATAARREAKKASAGKKAARRSAI